MARGEPLTTIDIALNEASWLTIALDQSLRRVTLGFDALTLPEGTGGDGHTYVSIVLGSVQRVVASLRRGRWDDESAEVVALQLPELETVVESFGPTPIYGWDFFDLPEESWERWSDRISLDERWAERDGSHSIRLFQEGWEDGRQRHLDARIWFEELTVYDASSRAITLMDFAAGARRWWDAMRAGDERTRQSGIVPLKPDDERA